MFRSRTSTISLLAAGLGSLCLSASALANDAMFPAEAAAADSIGWDGNYGIALTLKDPLDHYINDRPYQKGTVAGMGFKKITQRNESC